MRFDQLPGHRKVQRKEYALSTEQSKQEIDSALAFRRWFRPGQEVDMSMTFDSVINDAVSCPGCMLQCTETYGFKIKW